MGLEKWQRRDINIKPETEKGGKKHATGTSTSNKRYKTRDITWRPY